MKNTSRIIALLLVCCMLFGLAACGKKDNGPSASGNPQNIVSKDDNVTPTKAPVAESQEKEPEATQAPVIPTEKAEEKAE